MSVLLGYGNGTFTDMFIIPMEYGSRPLFVLIGDFNNDKKLIVYTFSYRLVSLVRRTFFLSTIHLVYILAIDALIF